MGKDPVMTSAATGNDDLVCILVIYRVYMAIYRVYMVIYRVYMAIYRVYMAIYRVYMVIYRVYIRAADPIIFLTSQVN